MVFFEITSHFLSSPNALLDKKESRKVWLTALHLSRRKQTGSLWMTVDLVAVARIEFLPRVKENVPANLSFKGNFFFSFGKS